MRGDRRTVVLMVAIAFLSAVVGVVTNVIADRPELSRLRFVSDNPYLSLGVLVGLTAVARIALWWWSASRPAGARESRRLDEAADRLAAALVKQWELAAVQRRLRFPSAVAVLWRPGRAVAAPLAGEPEQASPSRRFDPLPGFAVTTSETIRRGGDIGGLDSVFGGLPSGRLLIIGEPGAGKTSAAILMSSVLCVTYE